MIPTGVRKSLSRSRSICLPIGRRPSYGPMLAGRSPTSRGRCQRGGSMTNEARSSSAPSPPYRSTTRPRPSARCCAATLVESRSAPARTPWWSWGPAPLTRRASCWTRSGIATSSVGSWRSTVSKVTLVEAAGQLATRYPGLQVDAVAGDFNHHLGQIPADGQRLVVFLGGTVGNFYPEKRTPSSSQWRRSCGLGSGSSSAWTW